MSRWLMLLAILAFPVQANAQPVEGGGHDGLLTIFGDIARDVVLLPTGSSGTWLGGGAGLALAGHGLDDDFSSTPGQEWGRWSEFFDPGTYIGNGFVLAGAAVGTYSAGRLTGRPRLAHFGRDLIRAQAVSQIVVHTLKQATRRERPDGSGTLTFPSGHAAATFASAVVLHRHLRGRWTIPVYATAAFVGISRMHENKHYLSDVIFGSAIGIASGVTITRHIGNGEWSVMPAATRGGAAIVVTRTP
jgi:membrane-associated phospholipid phosphatase